MGNLPQNYLKAEGHDACKIELMKFKITLVQCIAV